MHEYQKMSESQIVNYVCEHTDLDRDMKFEDHAGMIAKIYHNTKEDLIFKNTSSVFLFCEYKRPS